MSSKGSKLMSENLKEEIAKELGVGKMYHQKLVEIL